MTIETDLISRSGGKCELCAQQDELIVYEVPPSSDGSTEQCLLICLTCQAQIGGTDSMDANHWRCLNDSMWSQDRPVQVMAWRLLTRLSAEGWPRDLLEMLYLDDETLSWAQATGEGQIEDAGTKHLDSNGAVLEAGDSVTLIKDLVVKGAGFTAKRGTAVRNISLVPDNEEHIEGRVNGQQIVILTKFIKKLN